MAGIASNRGPFTIIAGLGVLGTLALGGLVSPLASDYLRDGSADGDATILTTTVTPSLARVHLAPLGLQRMTVMRDGKPRTLLLDLGPECPPPPGWV